MGSTVLISFFADPPGTRFFSNCGRRMIDRCTQLGIRCDIRRLETRKGWLANTHMKGPFIRDMLSELGTPVLWVDVDAKILATPSFLHAMSGDFRPARLLHLGTYDPKPGDEPYTTPLMLMDFCHWWNTTDGARRLLDRWCELSASDMAKTYGDHRLLQKAVYDLQLAHTPVDWGYLPWPNVATVGATEIALGLANCPGRPEEYARGRRLKTRALKKHA